MKIGFTSRVCPRWDLATIAQKAAEFGYAGVELGAMNGENHLPAVRELSADPGAVKQLFANKKIELVCIGSLVTLDAKGDHDRQSARRRLLEVVELAAKLSCPFVRAPIGSLPNGGDRYGTLSRIARELASVAQDIARFRVTLLLENGGDFASSRDLWFLVDTGSHPAVAACWNPCQGMTQLERPTLAIPRLGKMIRLVRACDGAFDARGGFGGFKLPGEGDVGLGRMIDFLRGIIYRGYLIADWPKAAAPELPEPEEALPQAAAWLRERIGALAEPLTAYKGDKQAVKFRLPPGMAAPAAIAKPAKAKH